MIKNSIGIVFVLITFTNCINVANKEGNREKIELKARIDTLWFYNGKIKKITPYVNNKKHGKEITYDSLGNVTELYTYMDGVKEGEAYKNFYKKSMNGYVYESGKKRIEWVYMRDQYKRNFLDYYNHCDDSVYWVGKLYFKEVEKGKDLETYYFSGNIIDTVKNNDPYFLDIDVVKLSMHKATALSCDLINNKDTIGKIDTVFFDDSIRVPIKGLKKGMNKLVGNVLFLWFKDSTHTEKVKTPMLFYKWILVNPEQNRSL